MVYLIFSFRLRTFSLICLLMGLKMGSNREKLESNLVHVIKEFDFKYDF